ncbi:ribonuclease P protein component [Desulfonema ishimotonii]|uniref:Ribonuclease P protein component n=1 Tax=Desulfonema ishimotonii TaxID=45657 RepID=A0A401G3K9_9BACT|nr:ribonuclease P protein component [Desulfonema ishimotonii]GBC63804.1 ribonuclease P protein component [Desulfonema ishimotonii]
MDYSFPKADRILRRSEFLRLSRSGKKLHSRYFIANILPGKSDRTRLGITVTKKVGNAVTRNRLKRLSREFFRLNRQNITGNRDISIIVKKQAAALSTDHFFEHLENIFGKISGGGY